MPLAQAQKLIDDGLYQPYHMAWIVGTSTWCTIAEISELSAGFRPPGSPLGADDPSNAAPPPPPMAAKVPFGANLQPHSLSPKPYRRYAARALDTAILSYLLESVFGAHLPFGGFFSSLFLGVPATLLLIPIDTYCLERFQTTIGKYLFGIVVRSQNGTSLNRAQSLDRAVRVAMFGGALGIPGVEYVANFIAYLDIRRPENSAWDRAARCVVLYEDGTFLRQLAGSVLFACLEFSGMMHSIFG